MGKLLHGIGRACGPPYTTEGLSQVMTDHSSDLEVTPTKHILSALRRNNSFRSMPSTDLRLRCETTGASAHARHRSSIIVGLVTLFFWFVVLEVSDWANRTVVEPRQIVLTCLGVAVILLFICHRLYFWNTGVQREVAAIGTLIAVG
jgi:hypothetical protein